MTDQHSSRPAGSTTLDEFDGPLHGTSDSDSEQAPPADADGASTGDDDEPVLDDRMKKMYWRFGAMIATSTVAMFVLMYLNTYEWDHVQ